MLISLHLHKKSSEVSIKARSTPASLTIQGQVTKDTTVKWSIETGQVFQFSFKHKLEFFTRKIILKLVSLTSLRFCR